MIIVFLRQTEQKIAIMAKKSKKGRKQTDKFYEAEQRIEAEARNFFEENSKIITGITAGILALIILGYGYKQFITVPKEVKAQDMMIKAQQYFEKDSFNLALNGDGVAFGFKDVAVKYSGTKAGNGAKLYAGISALHIGEYDLAVKYLESVKTDDPILKSRKYGCIGDAKAELGDLNAAADNYQKALSANTNNEITAPFYLYKLAKAYLAVGKNDKAIEALQTLTEQFDEAMESADAEKELAKLQAGN